MWKLFLSIPTLISMTCAAYAEPPFLMQSKQKPIELTDSQMDSATAGMTGNLTLNGNLSLNIGTAVSTNVVIAPATAIAAAGSGNANAGATASGFASNFIGLSQSALGGGRLGRIGR